MLFESCEEAFAQGYKEGLKGRDLIEEVIGGGAETVAGILVGPGTKEYQSYRAGFEKGLDEWRNSSSSNSSSKSEQPDESSDSYSFTSYSSSDDESGRSISAARSSWLLGGMFWVVLIAVFYLAIWTFSALEYGDDASPFHLPWVPWLRRLISH